MIEFKAYIVSLDGVTKYVGVTKRSVARRWTEHQQRKSPCIRLLHAIKKHGRKAFTIEHVASARSIEDLCELEKVLIDQHGTKSPTGYNVRVGGIFDYTLDAEALRHRSLLLKGRKRGPMSDAQKRLISESLKGRSLPNDVRQKISKAQTGMKRPEGTGQRISAALRSRVVTDEEKLRRHLSQIGRKLSEETKDRIRAAKMGKPLGPFTDDHKAKISAANTGKKRSPETRLRISHAKKELHRQRQFVSEQNVLNL